LVTSDRPTGESDNSPSVWNKYTRMRKRGSAILTQAGFPNVASMAGGIDHWSLAVDPQVPRY
jgi:rhodanese-related sulfurtransferase